VHRDKRDLSSYSIDFLARLGEKYTRKRDAGCAIVNKNGESEMISQKMKPWGNYPEPAQRVQTVGTNEDIVTHLDQSKSVGHMTLFVGNGRSYGDSCLAQSGNAVRPSGLNQIIAADWDKGIIKAQAGILFSELLKIIVPKGWFFEVTPGSKFVTLGGAIANDVHGKNHHVQGTFGSCISRLALYRSSGETIECSRDTNADLFATTISGLGLTGVILWAEINLKPIASNAIETMSEKFETLEEFVEVSEKMEQDFEYVLAWIDYRSKDVNKCRGVVFAGRHSDKSVKEPSSRKFSVSITPPISLINNFSTWILNGLYYKIHARRKALEIVHYDKFFYPLDKIQHWNRVYGRKGFQQYQCVIPRNVAIHIIKEMLRLINTAGTGSFLSALKIFGDNKSPGLNSFPVEGLSLAIDFPQTSRLSILFPQLDELVHNSGGRLYPAKDAHMRGADFRRAYAQWEELEASRDPALMSRFWYKVLEKR